MSNTSSITEKRYLEISPKSLTSDGTTLGLITISSTYLFKVGMGVSLASSTQSILKVKVQRVVSDTQLIVIDLGESVTTKKRLDVSMYTVADTATIQFLEDKRPVIDLLEIQRQVYAEEPTVALRSHSVDWLGNAYTKENPMPVTTGEGILLGVMYDDIQASYPNPTTENFSYYLSTILVAKVEVTYADIAKVIFTRARRI